MANFDVFNGDADGLCALHQLRLTYPLEATLVTGPKRDVQLLQRVDALPGDQVTVLDISLDANVAALQALLQRGVDVLYFDHHAAEHRAHHARLRGIIDTAPDVCTSALVDRHLGGEHRAWAVVAAFGDGMPQVAQRLAEPLRYDAQALAQLRELGELINYNAYGDQIEDVLFHPIELYARVRPHRDPLAYMQHDRETLSQLRDARRDDTQLVAQLMPRLTTPAGTIYVMTDAPGSRRIRGDFAHQLAQREPGKAHAVMSPNAESGYTVSVRAPLVRNRGADVLCKQFATGGGRAGAGGVNNLPAAQFDEFARRFFAEFSAQEPAR